MQISPPNSPRSRHPAISNPLLAFVERATLAARTASRQVEAAARADDSTVGYPDFQFAGSLRSIARLIRADVGIRIFATELGGNGPGGFDTHAGQAANHGALLDQLSTFAGRVCGRSRSR